MPGDAGNDEDLLGIASSLSNFADFTPPAEADDPPTEETEPTPGSPAGEAEEMPVQEGNPGEALVPLLGMRMAVASVDLGYAKLVRARSLERAPDEVLGSGENVFALIECGPSPEAPVAATEGLRRLVTTLRLLKPGGVGLCPHGWALDASGWKRFATGAGRPRPGGYDLSNTDAAELIELSKEIASRRARTPSFAWALQRFDLGAERPNQVEGLSDYLLALRALLDGGGPANVGFTARAAALCSGAEGRDEVRATLELGIALERQLMAGERIAPGDGSPLSSIAATEEMLRGLLRGMASGELGSDLRITADEILLADGLRAGEGSASQIGGTAEWGLAEPEVAEPDIPKHPTTDWRIPDLEEAERIVAEQGEVTATPDLGTTPDPAPVAGTDPPYVEPSPPMEESGHTPDLSEATEAPDVPDWLNQTSEEPVEWPSFAAPKPKSERQPRRRPTAESEEQVRFLFPVPDEGDWAVPDFGEKRSRRA